MLDRQQIELGRQAAHQDDNQLRRIPELGAHLTMRAVIDIGGGQASGNEGQKEQCREVLWAERVRVQVGLLARLRQAGADGRLHGVDGFAIESCRGEPIGDFTGFIQTKPGRGQRLA